MAPAERLTTKVSTKGEVILPKSIRERQGTEAPSWWWKKPAKGVLLKTAVLVPRTEPKRVFGMLAFRGRPKTIEEMSAGILAEAKRRHNRD